MLRIKKIIKHPLVQSLLSRLLAGYIRLVYSTSRKIRHIDNAAQIYMQGKDNAIFVFWHGRMMLLPAFCPPRRLMRVLISLHRDGKLISQVIHHFGHKTVSGSSSKRGKEAVNEMLRALKAGDNVSITPDGPRGPNQVASKGVISVARLAQKPIVPVTFSSSVAKRLNSWDRFMLALPFGRVEFYVGAPIAVPRNMDNNAQEAMRLQVERTMNHLVERADAAIRA